MALIKCPECGGNVSDKAPACIHCGFPLQQLQQTTDNEIINHMIVIDGEQIDLSEIREQSLYLDNSDYAQYNELIKELSAITQLSRRESASIIDYIRRNNSVPKSLEEATIFSNRLKKEKSEQIIKENTTQIVVRCPKCASTQITTGQRGYNIVWGFWGSNKTTNRCANCGHSWQPK